MSKSKIILLTLLLVRIILYSYRPGGLKAYLLPLVLWSLLAVITLWFWRSSDKTFFTNKYVVSIALLASIFHIALLIDAGLITKFGKSPVLFTPLTVFLNTIMISSTLIGTEISRAYLLMEYGRRRPLLALVLMSLLHSPTPALIYLFISSTEPLTLVDFLGSDFLPALAKNMLASYLALLSGPIASLAYLAPFEVFKWYSPILPDLPWALESLIGVVAPTISLMAIDYTTPVWILRRVGLRIKPRIKLKDKGSITPLLMALVLVLAVWFSSGLFDVFPTIVISGSMRPTMEVGDIAILLKTPVEEIRIGDIIQYVTEDGMVVHRVVAIRDGRFVTKGDACGASDPKPIHPSQIRGKLIFIVPKIGWASLYLKSAILTIWRFLISNTLISSVVVIPTISSLYVLLRKRSLRRRFKKRWYRW